jgi:hypothetical protein
MYQCFESKELFPFVGEVHLADRNFPAGLIRAHLDTQCSADDLMAEADADGADPVVGKNLGGKVDQLIYPRDILERTMPWRDK